MTNISRRSFIRDSALFGTGIVSGRIRPDKIVAQAGSFLEKIGVCTGVANSGVLASAGFSYLEEAVRNFLVPAEDESVFQDKLALLKESRLPVEACNNFLPANLKCVGPAAAHEDILKFAQTAFRRAEIAGVKTIVFGSGGARAIPENYSRDAAREQFVNLCKRMAPAAEKYNVVISLEPLNSRECNFINSVAEGGGIVEAVGHRNFRLLADIYHMLRENESPASITGYAHFLYHTHIAENAGRSAPGVNQEDFTAYFKALKEAKYAGRMSIECNWTNLERQAASARQTIQNQLSRI